MQTPQALVLALLALLAAVVHAQTPLDSFNGSIIAALANIPEVSQFALLVNATKAQSFGMRDVYPNLTLSRTSALRTIPPNYTIIAFENDAYTALQTGPNKGLLATPANQAALLTYHLIPNAILDFNDTLKAIQPFVSTFLTRYGSGFDNLGNGIPQVIGVSSKNGTGQFSTGTVRATVKRSVRTDFGIIHVVTAAIPIPSDVFSTATSQDYNDFALWVNAANITNAFKSLQGITVLIPEQGALAEFLESNKIQDVPAGLKASILQYHIINGVYYSNTIGVKPVGKGNSLPANTPVLTYFNGQTLVATDPTHFATSGNASTPAPQKIQIKIPDILFDSGVIHIVDSILLPPTFTAGSALASATATPSPLVQISNTPVEEDPPIGSDFPFGAVIGGAVGGLFVVGLIMALYFVIRRRRLIALLEQERMKRQMEMAEANGEYEYEEDEEEEDAEYVQEEHGETDSVTFMVTKPTVVKKKVSSHQVPLKSDDDDDEDDDEDAGDDAAIKASYDQIMQYRRAQWASGDEKKKEPSSPTTPTTPTDKKRVSAVSSGRRSSKRVSIIDVVPLNTKNVSNQKSAASLSSSNANMTPTSAHSPGSKRASGASFNFSKRMSTASATPSALESVVITDAKEAKKETVRNAWWAATGVGANTHNESVLEAQAIREEQRKSWWSGNSEVAEQLASIESSSRRGSFIGGDKRKSVASSFGGGRRRSSNTGLGVYHAALGTGEQHQQLHDETELEYVAPKKLQDQRRSTSGGVAGKYKPNKASGLGDGAPVAVLTGKSKRKSGNVGAEYAAAIPEEEEETGASALASVMGGAK
ncbi:hypothetical protein BJ741DRAFT_630627 [Chytriomyces cf. hyalinus JEL632]|nr:hypothetical protein BJ741DRAFT_630627 [Chytriomyces cf. hyalinus JEL632]